MASIFEDIFSGKLKNIKIYNLLDFYTDEDYIIAPHIHEDFEHLILIIRGTLLTFLNDKKIILKEGDGIFIPSGKTHGFSFHQERAHFIDIKILTKKIYGDRLFNFPPSEKEFLYLYFSYIFSLWEKGLYKYVDYLIPGFLKMFSSFIVLKEKEKPLPEILNKCMLYIRSNYNHKITLQQLSKVLCVSPRTLSYYFSKYIGVSPIQYINDYRLKIAKIFLLEGRSIKETSYYLGFSSPYHFSNFFKKKEGISPAEYKKSKKSR